MDERVDFPNRRTVLKGAAVIAAAGAATSCGGTKPMSSAKRLTSDEIIDLLQLQPNATCGFVRVTFTSELSVAPGGLPAPFANGRPLGSALYFLVTPHAPVRPHRIKNEQLYHYYLGDPLEVFLLHSGGEAERVVVGPDIANGQRVQLLIPGNTFHTARLLGQGEWFLGASTEWPGVVPTEDVEIGDVDKLAAEYPSVADEIRSIVASVRVQTPPGGPR
ncbi:MAG TPA: cupin domain-containing protein [Sphingomicrobium sp.]|nr:cupin domain-containing protein [Sphingomicrobium sp.]